MDEKVIADGSRQDKNEDKNKGIDKEKFKRAWKRPKQNEGEKKDVQRKENKRNTRSCMQDKTWTKLTFEIFVVATDAYVLNHLR
jgi:hypothetical protein